MLPVALTIAGSDPSGGAGIQADLKTFHQHGVYGTSVITLLTVQNTVEVSEVEVISVDLVLRQLRAVLKDISPGAVKAGALGSREIISALSLEATKFSFPLVVDPVMISKHGAALLREDAMSAVASELLPVSYLVTPNLHEAGILAEMEIKDVAAMEIAARQIAKRGAKNVLVKGGHLAGDAIDVLLFEGKIEHLSSERIDSNNTHGTGCVLSAAITALLCRGERLSLAVRRAKAFVNSAIRTAPGLGRGCGPTNMFAKLTD